jgi:hypothetical protein
LNASTVLISSSTLLESSVSTIPRARESLSVSNKVAVNPNTALPGSEGTRHIHISVPLLIMLML